MSSWGKGQVVDLGIGSCGNDLLQTAALFHAASCLCLDVLVKAPGNSGRCRAALMLDGFGKRFGFYYTDLATRPLCCRLDGTLNSASWDCKLG